ncbi:hypothetical protein GUJ93_ZPchr0010g11268 [Zizania palustris]|uniref:Uncharacterized protein n=1 Tax=Zizania palustris TaxID=103762 RepID=A0A8J5WAC2_ZIZPA|nr:hypothetical protein GUJ93_ZPchr0010g11268 [Zizania palustris]
MPVTRRLGSCPSTWRVWRSRCDMQWVRWVLGEGAGWSVGARGPMGVEDKRAEHEGQRSREAVRGKAWTGAAGVGKGWGHDVDVAPVG